jgi:hypothetical protein
VAEPEKGKENSQRGRGYQWLGGLDILSNKYMYKDNRSWVDKG